VRFPGEVPGHHDASSVASLNRAFEALVVFDSSVFPDVLAAIFGDASYGIPSIYSNNTVTRFLSWAHLILPNVFEFWGFLHVCPKIEHVSCAVFDQRAAIVGMEKVSFDLDPP